MRDYRGPEFPDWTARPWAFPGILWRLPYWPVRLYLHVGDRVLFMLWWRSRPLLWRLEDALGADRVGRRLGGGRP